VGIEDGWTFSWHWFFIYSMLIVIVDLRRATQGNLPGLQMKK